jgi:hypothetical protein
MSGRAAMCRRGKDLARFALVQPFVAGILRLA